MHEASFWQYCHTNIQCWVFVTAQWLLHAIHSLHGFKSIVACHPTCLLHLSCYCYRKYYKRKTFSKLGKLEHCLLWGMQKWLDIEEGWEKSIMQNNIWHEKLFLSGLSQLLCPSSEPCSDWVVIEFFTDPSLFISRRVTPPLQKCNPLQAVVIPDRWADCSSFLQSNMTSYCHYLIPLSVILVWLTEKDTSPSSLSGSFTSSQSLPIHILILLFMLSFLTPLCTYFTI